jgi:hypothetical protein
MNRTELESKNTESRSGYKRLSPSGSKCPGPGNSQPEGKEEGITQKVQQSGQQEDEEGWVKKK